MSTPSTTAPTAAAATLFHTAKHPTTCLLHIVFKFAALATFTLGSLVFGSGDFVFTFVITTVLISIDFWVVKNLSGRLLVGLRWDNSVQEDGSVKWIYDAIADESTINATDKTIFWMGLIVWPMLWSILCFFYFIKLDWDWMILAIMALCLGGANLAGYWRCSTESKRKLQQFASSTLFKSAISRVSALFV